MKKSNAFLAFKNSVDPFRTRAGLRERFLGILRFSPLLLLSACKVGGYVTASPVVSTNVDVVIPTIAIPGTNPYYSNGNSVSITGLCETGDTVFLSGSASESQLCLNSSFTFYPTETTDGVYTYLIAQEDPNGGFSQPINLTWVRETSIPAPTLLQPTTGSLFASAQSALPVSGRCQNGATVAITGGGTEVTGVCANSAFSLSLPEAVDGDYSLEISQTDLAGNSASVPLLWKKHALSVSPPSATLVVASSQVFTPVGGSGAYTLTVTTNNSGGNLNSSTFAYTAGTLANQTDQILIVDSLGSSVTVPVTTVAAAADHLEIASGDAQNATAGNLLSNVAQVEVVDQYGNGIPSVQLVFRIIAGDAWITSSPIESSNEEGYATATVRMGNQSIVNTLEVSPLSIALPDLAGTGNSIVRFTETTDTSGNGSFGTIYATGDDPAFVLAADFNGDGIADSVVVNEGDNNVGIRLGMGNGLYGPVTRFGTCVGPVGAAVGDFRNNGMKDLAVVCQGSNQVSILLGQGNGSFQTGASQMFSLDSSTNGSGQNNSADTDPSAIVAADLNGDGVLDLAISSAGNNVVSIYYGSIANGASGATVSFTWAADYPVGAGSQPVALVVADFNKDGFPDLATANSLNATITVFLNSGGGTFPAQNISTYQTGGATPSALAAADFNGDGYPDLVVSDETDTDNNVMLFLNNKAGGFTAPPSSYLAGVGPSAIVAGDFNGDGLIDFAVANSSDSTVEVFYNSSSSPFTTSTTYDSGSDPVALYAFDGNGDSISDLLIVSNGALTVEFRPGQASTSGLGFTTPTGSNASAVVAADFNGDGKDDLAVVNTTAETVSVFFGTGTGLFNLSQTLNTSVNPQAAAVGDLNGDGCPDLVVANQTSLDVYLNVCDGSGSLGLSNGGSRSPNSSYPVGSGAESVAIADFDGDGNLDLAVAENGTNHVGILLGTGGGAFANKIDFETGQAPAVVLTGDFNGDGNPDLAVLNNSDGTVSILLNNAKSCLAGYATCLFQTHVDYAVNSGPNAMAVGDFNGDGVPDLAVISSSAGSVSILLGSPDGSLQPKNDYSAGNTPANIVTGNFNGSNGLGRLDLAISNGAGQALTVLFPDSGSGTFNNNQQSYGTGSSTVGAMAVGDFNGDGRLDLAVLDNTNNVVQLWFGN